jgi:(p)ppGpp synthase/HD superfamily hydrolase
MNNLLGLAISIAAEAHVNQVDKGGNPYILHPIRLMMRLRTDDHELMMIAVLHDVVEDSPEWTFGRLIDVGFSERVIDALRCLTHNHNESYDDYIERVCTNIDAIKVKKEDLRDNSDITRLKGISDKDLLRTRKYHRAFVRLCEREHFLLTA